MLLLLVVVEVVVMEGWARPARASPQALLLPCSPVSLPPRSPVECLCVSVCVCVCSLFACVSSLCVFPVSVFAHTPTKQGAERTNTHTHTRNRGRSACARTHTHKRSNTHTHTHTHTHKTGGGQGQTEAGPSAHRPRAGRLADGSHALL